MKDLAENKAPKLREHLTGNADVNPEPSLTDDKEGAETRRGLCIKCNSEITSKRFLKYCSSKCRAAYNSYKSRVKKGLISKPGVGSGGNQEGANNSQYKNGWTLYKDLPFKLGKPKICERCGNDKYILVHHKDEDRSNSKLENLEVLCKKCHQNHHCNRDPETGKYIKV